MSLIIICGATATGKSDLAVAVAKKLNAEIINADSMQVYKGMDIGTAKLSVEERQGVPHHLIDVLDINEEANVSWYQNLARKTIDELIKDGKSVVVVGGTGLYIKAILDDLNFPDTDPEVRQKITDEAEKVGNDVMHERLAKLDPAAAVAIPKENIRRVIRALEVIELTGKPFTANLPRQASSKYPDAKQFGLVLDRENLDAKIDKRVENMWAKGFAREVSMLMTKGLEEATTAKMALGYKQIMDYLNGECTEEFAKEETKRVSRAYARRQETWFSRDDRINWLAPDTLAARLEKLLVSIN
ncbi:MAG: tRNA (adenosine(37)-N6)-dimethylallyltransferase MiaA [Actinobacteria bacterium]|uniref:tRNA dimethylallyltransferase n=2 Tax=freshwater metagenome TaxID=449393 RepID=A0A6J6YC14_9ZZZZ|nr:tRNA (adenosine(37)-N6)-dimethylallyltransferase MiaA [Actinomycetota bacterium]MSY15540.1 tRNA (adenosine(37)-N6)-dimethylallyltransferase MiaA [Actinomycetota bacterium]MSY64834.1 tRNA (adenosine(37)-N6)-dimethylallyltransferase MiaA [Actinomycetota bacterium]MTA79281.1 tRNA (adenosine(37)-N6)-dimethylallyltransferase MiaA [Actinomycetota bacterium]MTA98796.1 tRNA (adenosine(37)-N6)-dimethylallyltransferase MiaA [Actinomycetota bacterium]